MKDPVVRTIEPEDADPLYLDAVVTHGAVLRLAAHLARKGYAEKAFAVRAAADAIIAAANTGIPRLKK